MTAPEPSGRATESVQGDILPGATEAATELSEGEVGRIYGDILDALHHVYDPEIPINIYEVGLIYGVKVRPDGFVHIRMTLTSPSCPAAQILPIEVDSAARAIRGVKDVKVDIVWEPTWTPAMMTEAARLSLGLL
ncbi:MAG TPA: iron-sulfur cluster assembly protein [Candidatus Thermoplasmatota archaeon]|nr:iron-sulfur cluster assembly protein [Candidatus Thermoplasmatota archaeon]